MNYSLNNIIKNNLINKKDIDLLLTATVSSLSPLQVKLYPGDDAINVKNLTAMLNIEVGSNVLLARYQSKFIIIGVIGTAVTGAGGDTSSIESNIDTIESEIDVIQSDITVIEGDISTLDSQVDSLGTVNSTQISQISSLATVDSTQISQISSLATVDSTQISQIAALTPSWSAWSPTLVWTGTPPGSITAIYRYCKVGKLVHFAIDLSSPDGNGATALKIPLPVAGQSSYSIHYMFTCIQLVGSTWNDSIVCFWNVPLGTDEIEFRNFNALTNGVQWYIFISGFYESAS